MVHGYCRKLVVREAAGEFAVFMGVMFTGTQPS